mmetsp:Transcript_36966/g.66502  ORF Transcript_36966/g.66502 Transcript_36966/m.66502 type:complete len:343 (-) Transcript_36966:254-1282(-)|eukprot:CAMPEP_0201934554 /NCGR_PEP_ID=MMETSP0903-20130614/33841_1 /ASSEMBLY_ACC=CAM_ASM_000552 /TAXON_ID=420261 /ORGANISM="Thalassiosira antarctica, Strain CCMP982" /LENGTH=342 /DNA_ID=CAMNT_0048474789 /DNA_START=93 /DNA_END=1121 /DNA_ORIENTATION=-
MSQGPPSMRRIPLGFDSIGAKADGDELKWSSTCSTDSNVQELTVVERATTTRGERRKKQRKNDDIINHEEEAILRKRRLIIMVFSLFPLLLATTALVAMATQSSSNNDKEDARTVASAMETAAAAPFSQIDVPTFEPTSASSIAEMIEATTTDQPSPRPIAEIIQAGTDQPSPHPTTAAKSQAPSQSSDETHNGGGLRPTTSPTYHQDLILSQPITTQSPTTPPITTPSPTTATPTSGPPTTAPTDYCVKSGVPCPNKKLGVHCCSGACEKNKETGEKVCAWIPEMEVVEATTPSPTNSVVAWEEEEVSRPLPCVLAGFSCPLDGALCCSDRCSKGKVKMCL